MNPQDVKRKLTAILSADVEGYSRLMGKDELGTIRTLTACRDTMTNLIVLHRGRVVDAPGDNLLAVFVSVVDAVQCAVEIQCELAELNHELPEDRRMLFRIGVNLGDVVEEKERIYGDGVNIAARLESLCHGGGVCISGRILKLKPPRWKRWPCRCRTSPPLPCCHLTASWAGKRRPGPKHKKF